jgi:hypothetical protein
VGSFRPGDSSGQFHVFVLVEINNVISGIIYIYIKSNHSESLSRFLSEVSSLRNG